ncbi:hypothetical protein D3C87_1221620 [compost metagenome]
MKSLILMTVVLLAPFMAFAQNTCSQLFANSNLEITWPGNLQPADYSQLRTFVKGNIENSVSFQPKKHVALGSVPWQGPKQIKLIRVNSSNLVERFSKDSLEYFQEKNISVFELSVLTAAHLGMELGVKNVLQGSHAQKIRTLAREIKEMTATPDMQAATRPYMVLKIFELQQSVRDLFGSISNPSFSSQDANLAIQPIVKILSSYYELSTSSGSGAKNLEQALSESLLATQQQGARMWFVGEGRDLTKVLNISASQFSIKTKDGPLTEVEAFYLELMLSNVEMSLGHADPTL